VEDFLQVRRRLLARTIGQPFVTDGTVAAWQGRVGMMDGRLLVGGPGEETLRGAPQAVDDFGLDPVTGDREKANPFAGIADLADDAVGPVQVGRDVDNGDVDLGHGSDASAVMPSRHVCTDKHRHGRT